MALPDKWIDGLTATESVPQVARHVVRRRLAAVMDIARQVSKSNAQDNQAIHQLRVSTRRAEAALLAFEPWLKKDRRKLARKSLKAIRKAAGRVRSTDVHCDLLRSHLDLADDSQRIAAECALMVWSTQRTLALVELVPVARNSRRALERIGQRWVRKAADPLPGTVSIPTLQQAGDHALAELARAFHDAAALDLTCRTSLHALRVEGKRLRYAIEIFGATATNPDMLAQLSTALTDLQERLGRINDYHEIAERLKGDASSLTALLATHNQSPSLPLPILTQGLNRLADNFQERCEHEIASFYEWWQSEDAQLCRAHIDVLAGQTLQHSPAEYFDNDPPEIVVIEHNARTDSQDDHPTDLATDFQHVEVRT